MLKRTLLYVGLIFIGLSLSFQSAFANLNYKVKSGDTLSKIAKKYGLKPQDIRDANGMKGSALSPKQVLIIPQKGSKKQSHTEISKKTSERQPDSRQNIEIYRVKRGDTIQSIAAMANCSVKTIRTMNGLKRNSVKVGRKLKIPKAEPGPADAEIEEDIPEDNAETEVVEEMPNPNPVVGTWRNSDERNLFIRVVKTFLGVPYRYGGSTLRGIDCSAFVKRVYGIVDINLPRTAREQSQIGIWVKRNELEDGDLVIFRSRRTNDHVGIYIGNSQFVHLSSKNKEAKIDHLDEPYFNKRFVRGVRVKELKSDENRSTQASLQS
jgi:LysM repeat protein